MSVKQSSMTCTPGIGAATLLFAAAIVLASTGYSLAADGLCGTCRLTLANTGKYLYKTVVEESSGATSDGIGAKHPMGSGPTLPESKAAAAILRDNIVLGFKKDFRIIRFDRKPIRTVRAIARRIGTHCVVFADEEVDVGETQATMVAYQFDDVIYPAVRQYLGHEANTGRDGDARVYILLSDIRDPEGSQVYTRGFYNPADMHAHGVDNPTSNEAEVLYLDTSPLQVGSKEFFQALAHQFAHMVLYNMDTYGGTRGVRESLWVDEGLALLAQYLCEYGHPHDYVEKFLSDTNVALTTTSFDDWTSDSPFGNYGASYLFALYVYERFGAEFLLRWTSEEKDGEEGFDAALKTSGRTDDFDSVFADWIVANLVDDVSVSAAVSYGKYGYRHIDLNMVVPAAQRISRFPTTRKGLVSARHGASYFLFHDAEASFMNILFDGSDEPNDFLLRTVSIDGEGKTRIDAVPAISNPLKLGERKSLLDVPRFGRDWQQVVLIVSQTLSGGDGLYDISAYMAGPRFSVFFNPVYPNYVMVSVQSLNTPYAYVLQQGMEADLSILLKPVSDNMYLGSYPVDRAYPGSAVFWAKGMGPDRTEGTVKWKVDVVNVVAGTKADIVYDRVALRRSAMPSGTTLLAATTAAAPEGVSPSSGLEPLGEVLMFSEDNATGACVASFAVGDSAADDPRVGIYRLDGSRAVPVAFDRGMDESLGASLTAGNLAGGTYCLFRDCAPPVAVSAAETGDFVEITIAESGSGVDRNATSFYMDGMKMEPRGWRSVESGGTETAVLDMCESPSPAGGMLRVIPVDMAGNAGAPWSSRVKAAGIAIISARVYPSPARGPVTIEMRGIPAGAAKCTAIVYDFAGHRVGSLDMAPFGSSATCSWNLSTADGDQVANGAYVVRTRAEGSFGTVEAITRFGVLR